MVEVTWNTDCTFISHIPLLKIVKFDFLHHQIGKKYALRRNLCEIFNLVSLYDFLIKILNLKYISQDCTLVLTVF